MQYDVRGRQTQLVDPDAGTYTYAYNGVGEQISQSDARGFATNTLCDPFGRKTTRSETQASGGLATTTWSYDCVNGKGLLCSVAYSGTNTPSGTANATSKTTTYDRYSRPSTTTTVIAGQSFVSQIAYDALGRAKYSVYPQATLAEAPLSLETSYNAAGYVTQVRHATTLQIYNQVNSRKADGQINTATLGNLLTQTSTYSTDGLARFAGVNVLQGATSVLNQTFGFESIGNLKARTLTASARAENEAFSYDALDRLTGNSGSGLPSPSDAGSYGFDTGGAGNLTSKASLTLGYSAGSNRLCAIAGSACGSGTGVIAHDNNGNIQSYTRPTQAQSGNAAGADGALLNLNGYSAFNLPTHITKTISGTVQASSEFMYDAGYQRIRQIKRGGPVSTGSFVDDILYVVPGGFEVHRNQCGQVISAIATAGGVSITTTVDPNTGVAIAGLGAANLSGPNTLTKLILSDHLGSIVAEVTLTGPINAATGTLIVHGFGPWGNARNAASPLAEGQRGFTGHEHLFELGIVHMNGRLYDAVLGRFLQADPIIQAPHNSQSHNRYSYVLNNPLSMSDPSGFSAWTKWRSSVVAAVVWAAVAYATSGCTECATYAANATRAGMNAHQAGRPVGRAIGASAAGTFVGTYAGPLAGAAVQSLADGGNVVSALKAAFSAGISEQFGVAAGGCASALMNRGSCWAGARDAMIGAGIQEAGSAAYAYVVSGGGGGAGTGSQTGKQAQPGGVSDAMRRNEAFFQSGVVRVNEQGDQTTISILATMKVEGGIAQTDGLRYAEAIMRGFNTVAGDDTHTYNISATILMVNPDQKADISLRPCGANPNCSGSFVGSADIGDRNIYLNTAHPIITVYAAHEFGHVLGFWHQENSTSSFMSYAYSNGSPVSITRWDAARLAQTYRRGE